MAARDIVAIPVASTDFSFLVATPGGLYGWADDKHRLVLIDIPSNDAPALTVDDVVAEIRRQIRDTPVGTRDSVITTLDNIHTWITSQQKERKTC